MVCGVTEEPGMQGIQPRLFNEYLNPFKNSKARSLFIIFNEFKNKEDQLSTKDFLSILSDKEVKMSNKKFHYCMSRLESAQLIRKLDRTHPLIVDDKDWYTSNRWQLLLAGKHIYRQILKPASMGSLDLIEVDPKAILKAHEGIDDTQVRSLLQGFIHIYKLIELLTTLHSLRIGKVSTYLLYRFTMIPAKEIDMTLREYSNPAQLDLHFVEREERMGLVARILKIFKSKSWTKRRKILYSLTPKGGRYVETIGTQFKGPLQRQVSGLKVLSAMFVVFFLVGFGLISISSLAQSTLVEKISLSIVFSAALTGFFAFFGVIMLTFVNFLPICFFRFLRWLKRRFRGTKNRLDFP